MLSSAQPEGGCTDLARLLWVDCPYPVATYGLVCILEDRWRVYVGREPPEEEPVAAFLGVGGMEGLLDGIRRIRKRSPGTLIIIVFGLYLDLPAARIALRAGARGYVHVGMRPEQVTRAVEVALKGEMVAPRQLLEYLIFNDAAELDFLSDRQREILELVGEGLTNTQIAKRLLLTESTVKQHLRAAYKVLGVSNRTEAARLVRTSD